MPAPCRRKGRRGALHHSLRQLRVPSGIQKRTIYVLQAMRLIISLPAPAHVTFLQSLPLSDFIPFHHLTADNLSVLLSRDSRSRRWAILVTRRDAGSRENLFFFLSVRLLRVGSVRSLFPQELSLVLWQTLGLRRAERKLVRWNCPFSFV